jgi:UTP-glucose-1-phosphate uridylyltransferase
MPAGEEGMLLAEENDEMAGTLSHYSLTEEQQLINQAKSGQKELVAEQLSKLFEKSGIPGMADEGTAHALLCCRDVVGDDNFAVVNADDFYGKTAYELAYKHLKSAKNGEYSMVGYLIKNTVTEEGGVSRGVCKVENGFMTDIVETHEITKGENCIYYPTPEGNKVLDPNTVVSMNFFCFTPDFFDVMEKGFRTFLEENKADLRKCEYYIALPVQAAVDSDKTMRVYNTPDKWYGVTYQRDKPSVIEGVNYLTSLGLYPKKLW